eukprot:5827222-Pyramimonas_sp.AAC.1
MDVGSAADAVTTSGDGCRRAPAALPGRGSMAHRENGPSARGAPSETADLRGAAARDASSGLFGADGDAATSQLP